MPLRTGRQLYMDLGNGVKAVNLWPVTTNGHTSPGCAVDYRAYGDYPVGAMHMEIRKSVLELSKFDDVSAATVHPSHRATRPSDADCRLSGRVCAARTRPSRSSTQK